MRSIARTIAAAVVVSLAAAGCIKLDTTITINEDESIDSTIVFAVNELLLEFAAMEAGAGDELDIDELLGSDEIRDQYEDIAREQGFDVDVTDYDEDGYVGTQIVIEGAEVGSFDEANGDLGVNVGQALTREGDFFILTQPGVDPVDLEQVTGDELGGMDPLELFEVRTVFEFPGEVVEASMGTIDGNTVTLDAEDFFSGEDLYIKAGATAPFDWMSALQIAGIVLGALFALALIGGAIWLYVVPPMRERRNVAAAVAEVEAEKAARVKATASTKKAPAKKAPAKKAAANKAPTTKTAAKKTPPAK